LNSKSKSGGTPFGARDPNREGKASSSKKGDAKREIVLPSVEERRGRGRPSGKRSDPNYVQTTAYIRGDTYKAVKIALIEEDQNKEYSELVEELLSKWLKSRK
jgi:hypothetical protein